jgi:hypothetical protein
LVHSLLLCVKAFFTFIEIRYIYIYGENTEKVAMKIFYFCFLINNTH